MLPAIVQLSFSCCCSWRVMTAGQFAGCCCLGAGLNPPPPRPPPPVAHAGAGGARAAACRPVQGGPGVHAGGRQLFGAREPEVGGLIGPRLRCGWVHACALACSAAARRRMLPCRPAFQRATSLTPRPAAAGPAARSPRPSTLCMGPQTCCLGSSSCSSCRCWDTRAVLLARRRRRRPREPDLFPQPLFLLCCALPLLALTAPCSHVCFTHIMTPSTVTEFLLRPARASCPRRHRASCPAGLLLLLLFPVASCQPRSKVLGRQHSRLHKLQQ